MEKEVQEFLDEVLKERRKKLLGLATDMAFFNIILEKYPEVALREQLQSENEKVVMDAKGEKVVEDKRDHTKIANLEKMIAKSTQAQKQLDQYQGVYTDIIEYISFIEKKDGPLVEKLNELSKK